MKKKRFLVVIWGLNIHQTPIMVISSALKKLNATKMLWNAVNFCMTIWHGIDSE